MQINNRTVHKMIEKLEYIAHHPHNDAQSREHAESMIEFFQTNFKSKPNYVKDKGTLSIHQ